MNIAVEERATSTHIESINLQVRYIGARKPFVDPHVAANTSLSAIKPQVLDFFGLTEGTADGGTKVYVFAQEGKPLSTQNATLGELAGKKHELKLDLIERFEQG